MPRPVRPPPLAENDPATLPESTRDYYRSTWGFDPVADCQVMSKGGFRYEECFPLSQDFPLQAVGITICARVDWEGEEIHNRIVFQRTDTKGRHRMASVECTHTVVYAGPASDALNFADDFDTFTHMTRANRARLNRTGRLVALPPWEHFAALKSYVAAVADMGVITLLRQSSIASTESTDGLPFGFNAEMQAQVVDALYTLTPSTMLSIYQDLTAEFLDNHPPAAATDLWYSSSERFAPSKDAPLELNMEPTAEFPAWGLLLRYLGTPTLIYWFRYTGIGDELQDRLFSRSALLAKAQAIAPDLPWDTIRLEWEARRAAKDFAPDDDDSCSYGVGDYLKYIPPAEIWARAPFCDYSLPRDILSPDTTDLRRSRVQAYLRVMKREYRTGLGDMLANDYLEWAQEISSHLDAVLAMPFPVDSVRTTPSNHRDATFNHYVNFTAAEVSDRIEHGDHETRRNVVLCYPVPPELQEKLTTHWDFATRLALVGNPGTVPSVIVKLAQDPQPCVRLAAAARVRRGTATCEPVFGEVLDPGEMVWLLSSHPGVVYLFGVTAWGDGSDAYDKWFKTRLREVRASNEYQYLRGELYAWAYSEGIFLEENEQGRHGSHLAYYGLTPYACGHFPCFYLGLHFLDDEGFDQ